MLDAALLINLGACGTDVVTCRLTPLQKRTGVLLYRQTAAGNVRAILASVEFTKAWEEEHLL